MEGLSVTVGASCMDGSQLEYASIGKLGNTYSISNSQSLAIGGILLVVLLCACVYIKTYACRICTTQAIKKGIKLIT